jgi:hypothetical protein
VAGSDSKAASDAIERDFPTASDGLGVMLRASGQTTVADRAAAFRRVQRAAAELDRLWLPRAGLAPARRDLAGRGVALIPLSSDKSPDQITDVAVELGSELDPAQPVRGNTAYTVGQGAAWAGLQDLSKHDLESAEVTGFPIVALILLFVLTGVPSIKEIGLGCAVAIALDATLVRLILVPAAMQLMGRWNWWIPGWLDRALPDLSFEGRRRAPEPASA